MPIETKTWKLVDPVARPGRSTGTTSHVSGGRIRTVAFFSNSKQHAAEIEAAMATALADRFEIEPRFYSKPNASVPATEELLKEIAGQCQAAVVGSAD